MRFELGLLVMSMVTGCYATSSHEVKRGDTFSVPGAAPIFMTFEDVKTTRVTSLALTKDDELFDTWVGSETTRSYPVTLDPATGATRPLAWANGQLTPFYWDAHREILWVAARRAELRRLEVEER